MSAEEVFIPSEKDLMITPRAFETAYASILTGAAASIKYPDDEAIVRGFVSQEYQTALGTAPDFNEDPAVQLAGAAHFGDRIVGALNGGGSWPGVILDFLGLVGIDADHGFVAQALGYRGPLIGVMTSREAQAFLIRVGVPVEDLAQVIVKLEGQH
jgi:hypothetical protein